MFEIKPKTRKEIYMAYLAGDMSLELPEPMTRDEVNLYNLCKNRADGETTTVKEVIKLKRTDDGITCDEHTPAEVVEILNNNPFTRMCLEFEDNFGLDYAMTFYFSAVSVIGSNGAFLVTFFTAIEPNSPIYKLVIITPDGFALEGE